MASCYAIASHSIWRGSPSVNPSVLICSYLGGFFFFFFFAIRTISLEMVVSSVFLVAKADKFKITMLATLARAAQTNVGLQYWSPSRCSTLFLMHSKKRKKKGNDFKLHNHHNRKPVVFLRPHAKYFGRRSPTPRPFKYSFNSK